MSTPDAEEKPVAISTEKIMTKMILCNPSFDKFLVTIERTDKEGYPEKRTCGVWPVNGKNVEASANFPGGRSRIDYLVQRLREAINPPNTEKKPWEDLLKYDPNNSKLKEEINKFNLDIKKSADPSDIWLALGRHFPEIKEATLKIKLFAEVSDETGVEREEIKFIGLISNRLEPLYKRDPKTEKVCYDENGKKIVEKWIDAYYYLGSTDAQGLPRITYRKEIIGSDWYDLDNPSELLYPKCIYLLREPGIRFNIRELCRKQVSETPAEEPDDSPPPAEDPNYEELFAWAKRD